MCIRDRFHHGPILPVRTRAACEPIPSGIRQVQRSQQRSACLLYTSDAADERSSVDLGGRRIIKKKTLLQFVGNDVT